jgi:hypothetical protein
VTLFPEGFGPADFGGLDWNIHGEGKPDAPYMPDAPDPGLYGSTSTPGAPMHWLPEVTTPSGDGGKSVSNVGIVTDGNGRTTTIRTTDFYGADGKLIGSELTETNEVDGGSHTSETKVKDAAGKLVSSGTGTGATANDAAAASTAQAEDPAVAAQQRADRIAAEKKKKEDDEAAAKKKKQAEDEANLGDYEEGDSSGTAYVNPDGDSFDAQFVQVTEAELLIATGGAVTNQGDTGIDFTGGEPPTDKNLPFEHTSEPDGRDMVVLSGGVINYGEAQPETHPGLPSTLELATGGAPVGPSGTGAPNNG